MSQMDSHDGARCAFCGKSQDQVKKPWALPKPTREKFPLDPLQKTPPTPSLFEGAPSPVGRTKQSFVNAERVENQWLVSTP